MKVDNTFLEKLKSLINDESIVRLRLPMSGSRKPVILYGQITACNMDGLFLRNTYSETWVEHKAYDTLTSQPKGDYNDRRN